MIKHTLIAFACLTTGVSAQTSSKFQPTDTERKSCLIQMAARLPRVEGMTIVAARHVPAPPTYSRASQQPGFMFVEIDFKAGPIEGTYGGPCRLEDPSELRVVTPGNPELLR